MLLFRYRGGWYTGCLHLQDLSPRNKWNLNKFIVYFLGTFDSVTSLLSLMSVWGWLVGRTICLVLFSYLKRREVTQLCSYRSTCPQKRHKILTDNPKHKYYNLHLVLKWSTFNFQLKLVNLVDLFVRTMKIYWDKKKYFMCCFFIDFLFLPTYSAFLLFLLPRFFPNSYPILSLILFSRLLNLSDFNCYSICFHIFFSLVIWI